MESISYSQPKLSIHKINSSLSNILTLTPPIVNNCHIIYYYTLPSFLFVRYFISLNNLFYPHLLCIIGIGYHKSQLIIKYIQVKSYLLFLAFTQLNYSQITRWSITLRRVTDSLVTIITVFISTFSISFIW